jgi:protein SCO1/2
MLKEMLQKFSIKELVLKKSFWFFLIAFVFITPIAKTLMRELPPPLPKLYQLSEFNLVRSDGNQVTLGQLNKTYSIYYFQFSRCSAVCLKLNKKSKEIQKRVLGLGDKIAIHAISVDPEFDSPQVLEAFSQKLGANPRVWHFYTTDKLNLRKLTVDLFKSVEPTKNNSTPMDIAHSGYFYLVDLSGWIRGVYDVSDDSVNKMLIELGLLVNREFK